MKKLRRLIGLHGKKQDIPLVFKLPYFQVLLSGHLCTSGSFLDPGVTVSAVQQKVTKVPLMAQVWLSRVSEVIHECGLEGHTTTAVCRKKVLFA